MDPGSIALCADKNLGIPEPVVRGYSGQYREDMFFIECFKPALMVENFAAEE